MTSSDDLLRTFYAIRAERSRLIALRASFHCARAERFDPVQDVPCWKTGRIDEDGRRRADTATWCQPCKKRQQAHVALALVSQRHGGALRGLIRRGRSLS